MSDMKRRGRPPKETNDNVILGDVELHSTLGNMVENTPDVASTVAKTAKVDGKSNKLGVFAKDGAILPRKATIESAGMDVCAFLEKDTVLKAYSNTNSEFGLHVQDDGSGNLSILIPPKVRVMVPTGLFLSIPEGKKVNVYPRSGLSLKFGVSLINCTGVVDADYTDELCVLLMNHSDLRYQVMQGERIAQIALEEVLPVELETLSDKPTKRADRKGGFGSTGKV